MNIQNLNNEDQIEKIQHKLRQLYQDKRELNENFLLKKTIFDNEVGFIG